MEIKGDSILVLHDTSCAYFKEIGNCNCGIGNWINNEVAILKRLSEESTQAWKDIKDQRDSAYKSFLSLSEKEIVFFEEHLKRLSEYQKLGGK